MSRRFPRWWLNRVVVYVAAALVLAYIAGPMLALVCASLQTHSSLISREFKWIPDSITFDAYRALFSPGTALGDRVSPTATRFFGSSLWNSIMVGVATTVCTLVLGTLAAYPLSRFRFAGKTPYSMFLLFSRMIPILSIIIPIYLLVRRLGIYDTIAAVVILHTAFILPFSVWILKRYFETVPRELHDAARIDGCSFIGTIIRVVLPVSTPGLISAGIYTFMTSWGNFLLTLMVTSSREVQTMPVVIAQQFANFVSLDYGLINAAGVVAIIPPAIFAFLFQRYLVSGLTAGSTKG